MMFLARWTSTFFGAGYFPFAPGTFASLLAVLIYKWGLSSVGLPFKAGVVIIVFLVGVAAASSHSKRLGQKDPSCIVIDEVCGQFLTFLSVPSTWTIIILGFFLFRVFDVLKPFPIRKLERLPSGWGIMADDILAGVYAALLLRVYILLR